MNYRSYVILMISFTFLAHADTQEIPFQESEHRETPIVQEQVSEVDEVLEIIKDTPIAAPEIKPPSVIEVWTRSLFLSCHPVCSIVWQLCMAKVLRSWESAAY